MLPLAIANAYQILLNNELARPSKRIVTQQTTAFPVSTSAAGAQAPVTAPTANTREQATAKAVEEMCTNHGEYEREPPSHQRFPTIIKDLDGKWYSIRCLHCGNNTTDRGKRFLDGVQGFFMHFTVTHRMECPPDKTAHAHYSYIMRNLEKSEVRADELARLENDPDYEVQRFYTPSGIKRGPRNHKSSQVKRKK